ncbi:hypothetical protein [Tsukamurella tyrosinosolvens]|uniref:hypothetical protein n=1 Tax=Tsukamurella tyrosinosolvens TaxID=57704 RepID=UPI000DF690F5|nr:hypothetical protein [Tsukamurella tyrosinosolvens]RDB44936.1 hypothetical protein DVB87_25960 [Tsukamurella tyrosinosolvens]
MAATDQDLSELTGGWNEFGMPPSSSSLLSLTREAPELGIELPDRLSEAVSRHADLARRLRGLREDMTPAPLTASDVLSDDYVKTVRNRVLAAGVVDAALHEVGQVLAQSLRGVVMIAAEWAKGEAYEDLNRLYVEKFDAVFLGKFGDDMTLADIRAVGDEETRILDLHDSILGAGAQGYDFNLGNAQWCLYAEWTKKTWTALVDSTGPNFALREGRTFFETIAQAGGTPRLARSRREAWERYNDLTLVTSPTIGSGR